MSKSGISTRKRNSRYFAWYTSCSILSLQRWPHDFHGWIAWENLEKASLLPNVLLHAYVGERWVYFLLSPCSKEGDDLIRKERRQSKREKKIRCCPLYGINNRNTPSQIGMEAEASSLAEKKGNYSSGVHISRRAGKRNATKWCLSGRIKGEETR